MWRIVLILGFVGLGFGDNDFRGDGGFVPSYQRTEDQLSEPTARSDKREDSARDIRDRDRDATDRTQRFGISSYGGNGGPDVLQGPFGATAPGLYGPMKIDLGGVLLGTILGFGAVLVLPKLIHALSYGYPGGYARSTETGILEVSDMLAKLDDVLSRYNIDSSSCVQRLSCSYVQLADDHVAAGNATDFDSILNSLSTNSIIQRALDGTSVMEAIKAGKASETDCQALYPKCKLDKKAVVKILTQMMP